MPEHSTSSARPSDRTPLWDREAALRRLGGDERMLYDMVGFFEEDVPVLIASIEAGVRQLSFESVARAAHSTKGLCLGLGAATASEIASRLEAAATTEDQTRVATLLPELREEIQCLSQELQQWHRGEHPASPDTDDAE